MIQNGVRFNRTETHVLRQTRICFFGLDLSLFVHNTLVETYYQSKHVWIRIKSWLGKKGVVGILPGELEEVCGQRCMGISAQTALDVT